MITVKTSSLFWKKFPYKVVVEANWAGSVRYANYEALDKIDAGISKKDSNFYNDILLTYPRELRRALEFIDRYDKDDLRFRCEGRYLSLFFKDRNILGAIQTEFGNNVAEFHTPASDEVLDRMLNHKIIVKDHLIHGCRYKVMLRDRMELLTDASKSNLARLLKNNTDRYANVDKLITDLEHRRKYIWQTYIYARESKDLLMLQMIAQPVVREVIKIVTHAEVQEASTADEQ
jgi:hypothetical protein